MAPSGEFLPRWSADPPFPYNVAVSVARVSDMAAPIFLQINMAAPTPKMTGHVSNMADATFPILNMAPPIGRSHFQHGGAYILPAVGSEEHQKEGVCGSEGLWARCDPIYLHPRQGLAPSSAGYGPLRDLPDWSFVDGRPAPPWKGQTRRRQEDEAFARRVAMLHREMEQGLQRWQIQQRQQQEAKESKRQSQLQPKGAALRRGSSPQ
ncbi:large ribosomal subunit protein mL52 [Chelonoidis abingdonii]|uniref:large ribosomal subunit protein mL52 n=1 Tax=Chelonoidis abingdonii TaxID=106734 RepID=UPI003F497EE5